MKKLVLFLLAIVSLSSCVVVLGPAEHDRRPHYYVPKKMNKLGKRYERLYLSQRG